MTSPADTRFSIRPTDHVLADGTQLTVRGLEPHDGDALRAFHGGLSAQTVYYRFFCARGPLTDAEVDYFTHVDQRSRVALGVFAGGVLVAVGRYDRVPGTSDAEVACVVTDAWQHRGVGTLLLARLVGIARRSGVRRFVAETLLSNTRMLRLLSEVAPMRTTAVEAGFAHVLVDLPARPRVATDRRHRRRDVRRLDAGDARPGEPRREDPAGAGPAHQRLSSQDSAPPEPT